MERKRDPSFHLGLPSPKRIPCLRVARAKTFFFGSAR
jgi:hypothetical protein